MPEEHVKTGYHVLVDIPDVSDDLLFYQFTPPSASLPASDFKCWSGQGGMPENKLGGGTQQVTWTPVTFARGVDPANKLWKWFDDTIKEGFEKQKKTVTVEVKADPENTMHTWNLVNAIITNYSHSAANAQTHEVLVQTVTLSYEYATLE